MWRFFSEAWVRRLAVFWGALVIGGLFVADWFRAAPSIGMAGLFLTGIGYAARQQRIAQRAHWRATLSFSLVYLLHAATGLLHGGLANKAVQQDLVLQLPFLLLPGAFLLLPDWTAAHKRALWLWLLGCCLVSAGGATVNYLLHYEVITETYMQSKVMPTVPDHIRFSLLISMAVVAVASLAMEKKGLGRWRWLAVAGAGLLFLFQHLLAARSGLITMYAAGALGLAWLSWQLGRWQAALLSVVAVAVLAGGCWLLFPTLKNRLNNTQTDFAQLKSVRSGNDFSLTARVYSFRVAAQLIRRHPLGGVGKAKLEAAMAEQYQRQFPEIEQAHYLLPHNQFIYNLAAYGALGLAVFLLGFYYPLWAGIRQRNGLLLLLYLIVTLSFLSEYTLETQIGVVTGLFFLLLAAAPVGPDAEA